MGRRMLFITDAGEKELGARIRVNLLRPEFERNGWETAQVARIPTSYAGLASASARMAGGRIAGRRVGRIVSAARKRVARFRDDRVVRMAKEFDVVFLHKVPSLDLVLRLREETDAIVVFDHCDPIRLSTSDFGGGKGAFGKILRAAHAVTTDNPVTAAQLRNSGNPNVHVVPDPCQVELFDEARNSYVRDPNKVVLGWVSGRRSMFNLYKVWEALERLSAQDKRVELRILGHGDLSLLVPTFEHVRWSALERYDRETMIREVLQMDIGLFPQFDTEDATMRGVLKATIYMAGEACVVASPRGQLKDLIRNGENGVLAETSDEWYMALQDLVNDPIKRKRLAAAGLRTAREEFTLQRTYECLVAAIDSAELKP